MSRRKYKSRPPVPDDPPAPHVDPQPVLPPNHDVPGAEPDARTALASRVAELSAAEAAQRQHLAALTAQAQAQQRRASSVPSRLQQWIAEHQAEVTDPRTNARLQAAHFGAIADVIEIGGDEYMQRLEAAIAHHVHAPVPEPEPVNGGTPMPSY
jgi:hypothetical protein